MELKKFEFPHSLKNIPVPKRDYYLKMMILKVEQFIERLRWKVCFFLNPPKERENDDDNEEINTFGFKTTKTAPQSKELTPFENELYLLIANIQFCNRNNKFQSKLKTAIAEINKSEELFIPADKTSNIYKVKKCEYDKLLTNSITKDYKKTTRSEMRDIDLKNKEIAENLQIADRMEQYSEGSAFISLKDHKEDFRENPKCRLINPAKSDIGKVSKQILQRINSDIRANETLGLRQWQSTDEVLDWFRNINNKERKRFLQLDVVEFYPSITERLLAEALEFADKHSTINECEKTVIKQARNSLLFTDPPNHNNSNEKIPWKKKNGLFDVTMGAPDGAEICELVGLLLLHKIKNNTDFKCLDFGLYRDDGLAVHNMRISGNELDSMRKKLEKLFGEHDLRITVSKTSLKRTDFLDVTMDLENRKYLPYRKPNDTPLYIDTGSNHPPSVLKQVPKSIEKRLNNISSNERDFYEAIPPYQKALDDSGHKYKLKYTNPPTEPTRTNNKDKKKRDIVWFNPPYNASVKTNIGKQFLQLIDKHFPKDHPLRQVVNRNCVKISYSCTKNMKQIMQSHNRKILTAKPPTPHTDMQKNCNCREENKEYCPLENNCQQAGIYKATVQPPHGNGEYYVGSTIDFKQRWDGHKFSFRHYENKGATALSHHLWDEGLNQLCLTEKRETNPLKWEILENPPVYQKGGRYCELCLTEKLQICKGFNDPKQLNRRTDIALKCKHRAKWRLNRLE